MSKRVSKRQGLRISTMEGSWATLHAVLTSGGIFTAYVLFLGANDFQLALLSAMPLLAQVIQIPGAWLVERTGKRRLIVGWFSVVSRTFWLPIALIPLFTRDHGIRLFVALYLASSIVMNFSGAGWVAWMSALVPNRIRGRYFATRNNIIGLVTIVSSLAGGFVIDAFRDHGHAYGGFLTVMAVAVFGGLMAFRMILQQPDPEYRPEAIPPLLRYLFRPLADTNYRRIVLFYLYWLFAVNLASPFFNAHLLKYMHWNQKTLALFGVISSVSAILSQRGWGHLLDRYGNKPVLMITAIGIIHLPLYYVFCPWTVSWPMYANALFTGLFWAGFGLASFTQLIDVLPSSQRTMYVALMGALSGVTNFISMILGGWLAHRLDGVHWQFGSLQVINYQVLFVITTLLRIPALLLLRRIREPDAQGTAFVMRKMLTAMNRRIGLGRLISPVPARDNVADFPRQP